VGDVNAAVSAALAKGRGSTLTAPPTTDDLKTLMDGEVAFRIVGSNGGNQPEVLSNLNTVVFPPYISQEPDPKLRRLKAERFIHENVEPLGVVFKQVDSSDGHPMENVLIVHGGMHHFVNTNPTEAIEMNDIVMLRIPPNLLKEYAGEKVYDREAQNRANKRCVWETYPLRSRSATWENLKEAINPNITFDNDECIRALVTKLNNKYKLQNPASPKVVDSIQVKAMLEADPDNVDPDIVDIVREDLILGLAMWNAISSKMLCVAKSRAEPGEKGAGMHIGTHVNVMNQIG